MEESARRTFTSSPATRPERGQEGKDTAHHVDAIATVLDAVERPRTPRLPNYTHSKTAELPPTSRCRKRQPEAEGSAGLAGESTNSRVASLLASSLL